MKATVTHLNPTLGYYAANTERSKVVFSVIGPVTVQIDDILDGDFENLGVHMVTNESQNSHLKVDIQELHHLYEVFRAHG